MKTIHKIIIFLSLLFFLLIQAKALSTIQPADEYVYFYMAKLIYNGLIPYKDFFYAHPPLQLYLYAPVFFFGFNNILLKSIPLLMTFIISLFVYLITRERFGENIALISFMLFLFNYITLINASMGMGVIEAIFFMVLGIWLLEKTNYAFLIFLIAVFIRLQALFPIIAILIIHAVLNKKWRPIINFGILFIILNLLFCLLFGNAYFNDVYAYHLKKPLQNDYKFSEYLAESKILFILFFFTFVSLIFFRKEMILLYLPVAAFIGFLFLSKVFYSYYFMIAVPFLSILGAIGIYNLIITNKRIMALLIFILLLDSGINIFQFYNYNDNPFSQSKNIEKFIKQKNLEIIGESSVTSLLALKTDKIIFNNRVDENVLLYQSKIKKLKDLFELVQNNKIIWILRSREGIYNKFEEVQDFVKDCRQIGNFHDSIEGDYMFYECW